MKCNIICNFAIEKKLIKMRDINSQNIKRFNSLLSEASKIVITTHMNPDGDALGSSLAMHGFLKASGMDSKVVLPDATPANLNFLITEKNREDMIIYEDTPSEAESAISGADLIICLDFNAFHRTDRLEAPLSSSEASKVLIDHHLNPDREKFDVSFSETQVSSASELLYHILMAMPQTEGNAARLPAESLNALMTGMTTDTNNFANSVFPSTLQMASGLLAAGADRDMVLSNLYNMFSESRLRLLGHMMKDLLKITDDGVAYIVLDKETLQKYNVAEGDTEGFVNMPLSIKDVRMSILIKEDDGKARVSIRSKKGTSANRCAMKYFNGGGHENAAGGKLLIPKDIESIEKAGEYIETHTYRFFNDENEK